ncbi:DUF5391 family protein [Kurthia senegalensis]|uniref:DUF5391 family protein n=1 Tax=Kurthia senegalensis TaxID=1033740 RepID=UPI000289D5EB|nr:DUF5391 family protein [Kurthia senegalensis]
MEKQRIILFSYIVTFICGILFVLTVAKAPISHSGEAANQWASPAMWLAIIILVLLFVIGLVLYIVAMDAKGIHIIWKLVGIVVFAVLGIISAIDAMGKESSTLGMTLYVLTALIVLSNLVAVFLLMKKEKRSTYGSYSSYR